MAAALEVLNDANMRMDHLGELVQRQGPPCINCTRDVYADDPGLPCLICEKHTHWGCIEKALEKIVKLTV